MNKGFNVKNKLNFISFQTSIILPLEMLLKKECSEFIFNATTNERSPGWMYRPKGRRHVEGN